MAPETVLRVSSNSVHTQSTSGFPRDALSRSLPLIPPEKKEIDYRTLSEAQLGVWKAKRRKQLRYSGYGVPTRKKTTNGTT